MFKKGQAAMEFLMTYGWAILVVLAAIGALAYFGVLSPDNLLPERTSFQAPIPNVDTASIKTTQGAAGAGIIEIEIAFSNSVGQAITPSVVADTAKISSITIDSTPYTCTALGDTVGLAAPVGSIANAATFTYKWTCTAAEAVPANLQNKRVKADLSFEYTNAATSQTKTHSGNVNGKVSVST